MKSFIDMYAVLSWMEYAVQLNIDRGMDNPNISILSSDSFMLNLSAVMLQLCKPFLVPGSKAQSKIDPDFLRSNTEIFPPGGLAVNIVEYCNALV